MDQCTRKWNTILPEIYWSCRMLSRYVRQCRAALLRNLLHRQASRVAGRHTHTNTGSYGQNGLHSGVAFAKNNGENRGPLNLLPVDHQMATESHTTACAKNKYYSPNIACNVKLRIKCILLLFA